MPFYDLKVPRAKADGGTWWHKIGSAKEKEAGRWNLFFDSLPLADKEGKCMVIIVERKEFTTANQPEQPAGDLDDKIPW